MDTKKFNYRRWLQPFRDDIIVYFIDLDKSLEATDLSFPQPTAINNRFEVLRQAIKVHATAQKAASTRPGQLQYAVYAVWDDIVELLPLTLRPATNAAGTMTTAQENEPLNQLKESISQFLPRRAQFDATYPSAIKYHEVCRILNQIASEIPSARRGRTAVRGILFESRPIQYEQDVPMTASAANMIGTSVNDPLVTLDVVRLGAIGHPVAVATPSPSASSPSAGSVASAISPTSPAAAVTQTTSTQVTETSTSPVGTLTMDQKKMAIRIQRCCEQYAIAACVCFCHDGFSVGSTLSKLISIRHHFPEYKGTSLLLGHRLAKTDEQHEADTPKDDQPGQQESHVDPQQQHENEATAPHHQEQQNEGGDAGDVDPSSPSLGQVESPIHNESIHSLPTSLTRRLTALVEETAAAIQKAEDDERRSNATASPAQPAATVASEVVVTATPIAGDAGEGEPPLGAANTTPQVSVTGQDFQVGTVGDSNAAAAGGVVQGEVVDGYAVLDDDDEDDSIIQAAPVMMLQQQQDQAYPDAQTAPAASPSPPPLLGDASSSSQQGQQGSQSNRTLSEMLGLNDHVVAAPAGAGDVGGTGPDSATTAPQQPGQDADPTAPSLDDLLTVASPSNAGDSNGTAAGEKNTPTGGGTAAATTDDPFADAIAATDSVTSRQRAW